MHLQTGKVRWIAYSASPLSYEDKQRILVVLRDVTTEKELQLSMKDAMTAAEAANQAKSEFLSRMSHEIRTPMNAIIGMLQIAKLHTDDAERTEESLRKIGAASDHLLNLINDVLDISKIESGKMVLTSEPFRLSVLLARPPSSARNASRRPRPSRWSCRRRTKCSWAMPCACASSSSTC